MTGEPIVSLVKCSTATCIGCGLKNAKEKSVCNCTYRWHESCLLQWEAFMEGASCTICGQKVGKAQNLSIFYGSIVAFSSLMLIISLQTPPTSCANLIWLSRGFYSLLVGSCSYLL